MKNQILLNQTVEGCCPTVTAGYYKYGVATLVTGNFGTTGGAVLEIEEMSDTNKIINVGQYDSSQNSRIVSSEGISYAVTNGHKDGMPKIIQEAINTDANGNAKAIRACYGQCGYDSVFRGTGQGITGVMEEVEPRIMQLVGDRGNPSVSVKDIAFTVCSSPMSDRGQVVVEPKIIGYSRSSEGSGKIVGRHLNDYANTITRSTGSGNTTDMYVAEPKIAASRGRGEGWKQQLEINESGTSYAITSVAKDNYVMEQNLKMDKGCLVDNEGRRYRIRKLTPRECFRLQDVSESDIDKMLNAKIAKTNLYKLAGNSICISPMYHIFRKLFIQKECESQQLELF